MAVGDANMLTVTWPASMPLARYSPRSSVSGAATTAALCPLTGTASTITDTPITGSPLSSITAPEMTAPLKRFTTTASAGACSLTGVSAFHLVHGFDAIRVRGLRELSGRRHGGWGLSGRCGPVGASGHQRGGLVRHHQFLACGQPGRGRQIVRFSEVGLAHPQLLRDQ